MDTFTWVPCHGSGGAMQPRVLHAQFGDGYSQDAQDGINNLMRQWDLTFDPINAVTGTTSLKLIDAFFAAQGGYKRFLWTQPPPYDVEGPKTFVCPQWQFTYQSGLVTGLRATFMQRPDV